MAIKMKASQQAVQEAQAAVDFEQAPPGLYVIKLAALAPKFAQKDGKDDKTRPYVEARWQIVGVGKDNAKPEKAYSGLFDVVSLSEESEWKRAEYAVALGKTPKAGEFVLEENPDKPGTDIGKLALGRVKKDADLDGNYRAKLGKVFAFEAGGESGDLSGSDEESDPFAADDTEEEGGGGPEYLTREGLEAMEPADIKEVLEQFDLDPKQFKGKTAIADAIDAILEAQGTVGGDGEDEEESPF